MAFFSLTAYSDKDDSWRTCAIFAAADKEAALRRSRELRANRHLSFLPYPTSFRMRVATRRELDLLHSFMRATNNTTLPTFSSADLDGMLHRRRKLLGSFFLALYHDPDSLMLQFGSMPDALPASTPGATGSGGTQSEVTLSPPGEEPVASDLAGDKPSATKSEETTTDSHDSVDILQSLMDAPSENSLPGGELDLDFG